MPAVHEPTPAEIASGRLYAAMGLTDAEYEQVQSLIGRRPNYTETGLYSVMWSEHCSYKNSKPVLKRFPTTGSRVLQGPGEGAGAVDIGGGLAVVFKIESHNHPSAVEPYQGAATGVGGIIRDVFSMGARPIALLDSLRFGELDQPATRYLFSQVVAGIAGYGNCVGIPTVGGETSFDPCYEGNPLVNAMCVGLIEHDKLQQGRASGVGNAVIYVGASTGRDGIHGATFASANLDQESEQQRPAVQVGDPFMEKLLLEACLELVEKDALIGIQDMGAAGLASSSSEMAGKAGTGMELDLDKVPQRESGMTAYDMLLSESQERMLLVVTKEQQAVVESVCAKWGLACAVIGRVTADRRYRIRHNHAVVVDVPVASLVDDVPVYHKPAQEPASYRKNQQCQQPCYEIDEQATLLQLLAQPSIASKEWVYRQYDHTVRTCTTVRPGSDAAVVRIRATGQSLAMTTDCSGRYLYLDPRVGGAAAVAEAARNLSCVGAEPLALTNCLNFGSPEQPESFWQLEQAVDGMSAACRTLGIPVISGNVSLYNESEHTAIYPTPVVGMVGLLNAHPPVTTAFKAAGETILLLGETKHELGGSELQKLCEGTIAGRPPQIELQREATLQQLIRALIRQGLVTSAHDPAEGGLAVALAEAAIAGQLGCRIRVQTDLAPAALLFSESQSRIVLTTAKDDAAAVQDKAHTERIPCTVLGEVTADPTLSVTLNGQAVMAAPVDRLAKAWKEAIPCYMEAT